MTKSNKYKMLPTKDRTKDEVLYFLKDSPKLQQAIPLKGSSY
jgi:hypothetical protein